MMNMHIDNGKLVGLLIAPEGIEMTYQNMKAASERFF